jgi:hypothetical protein
MSGLADSLQRSQQNIDTIADWFKTKRNEDEKQRFYGELSKRMQPQESQDVLSSGTQNAPPQSVTGLSPNSPVNKPLVLPNTQPGQDIGTALMGMRKENPQLFTKPFAQEAWANEQAMAPRYENIQPGTYRQRVNAFGQPEGQPEQVGQKLPNNVDEQYIAGYKKAHPGASDVEAIDALNKSKVQFSGEKAQAIQDTKQIGRASCRERVSVLV